MPKSQKRTQTERKRRCLSGSKTRRAGYWSATALNPESKLKGRCQKSKPNPQRRLTMKPKPQKRTQTERKRRCLSGSKSRQAGYWDATALNPESGLKGRCRKSKPKPQRRLTVKPTSQKMFTSADLLLERSKCENGDPTAFEGEGRAPGYWWHINPNSNRRCGWYAKRRDDDDMRNQCEWFGAEGLKKNGIVTHTWQPGFMEKTRLSSPSLKPSGPNTGRCVIVPKTFKKGMAYINNRPYFASMPLPSELWKDERHFDSWTGEYW